MVKAVKYDLIFLLVPVLEALESKGKISLDDLEIPQKLRQCALKWVFIFKSMKTLIFH